MTQLRADFEESIDDTLMNSFTDSIDEIEHPYYFMEISRIIEQQRTLIDKAIIVAGQTRLRSWVHVYLKSLPSEYMKYPQYEVILETIPEIVECFRYFRDDKCENDSKKCRAALVSLAYHSFVISVGMEMPDNLRKVYVNIYSGILKIIEDLGAE